MFARRKEHVPGRQGKTWPYEKSTGDSDIEVVEVSSVPMQSSGQCCGSGSESGSTGSTCFWTSWIRIRIYQSDVWIQIRIRIWILLSPSKKSKKNLDSYCFVTFF